MNYKTLAAIYAFGLILMCGFYFSIISMGYDIGKESKALEILAQCKAGEIVTINDTEIHCGIISKEINIKAAQYRGVKNCVKLIKGWEDE